MIVGTSGFSAVSNNLANASTAGYAPEEVSFRDLVSGGVAAGSASVSVGRSFTQGPLTASTKPLAVALDGAGFLQVANPTGGTALTRAGDLHIDNTRRLVDANGNPLVPELKIPAGIADSATSDIPM